MIYEVIGLIIYILLLGFAIYIYRLTQGWYINKVPKDQRTDLIEWVLKNKTWLKYLALFMAAIMAVNIFFSLAALGVF